MPPTTTTILVSLFLYPLVTASPGHNDEDSLRYESLMSVGKSLFPDSVAMAHTYTDSARSVAENAGLWRLAGLAIQRRGMYSKATGDFVEAEHHFFKGKEIFEEYGYFSENAWVTKKLGDLEIERGDYLRAMDYYIKAIRLAEQGGDKKILAYCYREIAYLYHQHHENEKSLENIQKGYGLLLETNYETTDMAALLTTMAIALSANDMVDSAIACYETAIKYNRESGDNSSLAGNLNNLALIYENKGMYDKALPYYQQCLAIDSKAHDAYGLTYSHIGIANVFFKMEKPDSALYHARKSFAIAGSLKALQRIQKAGESLIRIYKAQDKYDSALHYYEIITEVKDSLFRQANVRDAFELQAKYEADKKDDEIFLLTKQKEEAAFRQKTYFYAGLGIFLLALLLYNQQRIRSKKNKLLLEKEMELDRMKSQFFANISHEFRTPLTLILSPLDAMISHAGQADTKNRLKVMKSNARKLLGLVNQLLDLSKIESGKMKLRLVHSDIMILIKGVATSFYSLAEKKNIKMAIGISRENLFMNFDPEKVETVLTNLLSNAFKFSPENGKITIKTKTENVGKGMKKREFLRIDISDEGPGIPPAEIDMVFNRFYQSGNNSLQQKGSGIGLALAKELVEMHEGKISLQSEEGKGTQISVYLPVDLPLTDLERPPSRWSPQKKLPEIHESYTKNEPGAATPDDRLPLALIIEDHSDVQNYIKGILKKNYNVRTALDGAEGIKKALATIPDIIISDVMMPAKDGYEVCKALKNDERTSHIPIILLTAKSDLEDKIEGLASEADDYINKPFFPEELLVRMANLLRTRKKLKEKYKGAGILKPREIAENSVDEKFLEKLIQLTEANMGDELFGVERLSAGIGMSRSQLHRKLTALLGHGPNQLIRSFRLQRAHDLLGQHAATASEIAYLVGFSSPSYFTKCFHKQFGYTPSEVLGRV